MVSTPVSTCVVGTRDGCVATPRTGVDVALGVVQRALNAMRNECEWHRSPCHLLVGMHACLQPVERITEASKKLSVGRSRQHRQHRAWEEWGPLLRQPAKHTHPATPNACCVASFVRARAPSRCVPPSATLRHARVRWAPRPSRCTVSVTRTQNPCHGSFPMEEGDARVTCA